MTWQYAVQLEPDRTLTDIAKPLAKSLVKRIPSFILRWYWKESRLAERVRIDLCPGSDSLQLNGGKPSSVTVRFRITNLSPFKIQLDRMIVEAWCNGRVCQPLHYIERIEIASTDVADVCVRGGEGIDLASHLANVSGAPYTDLNVHAYFNCAVRNFEIDIHGGMSTRPVLHNIPNELRQKLL